jgi:hypothetical protein
MTLGRILNRFSNDINKADGGLPDGFGRTIMESLTVAVNIVILGISLPVSNHYMDRRVFLNSYCVSSLLPLLALWLHTPLTC